MNFEKVTVVSPSDNYKIISQVEPSTAQDIDFKVNLAHGAFEFWSKISIKDRIIVLEKLLKTFIVQKDEIAKTIAIEMGMPLSVCMKIDIEVGLNYFKGYLDNASEWLKPEIVFENQKEKHIVYFESLGVVAASIAWNFPFTNFVWAAIQNLVAGNTIIIKHSENCILTAKLLESIIENSDLPKGICSFVHGKGHDVGEYVINSDVDMIWFVGGVVTGHHIYQVAASKDIPAILELGGSAPALVFEDVDLDQVVESIYFYRFANSGQSCDAIKRLIVHESIFDQIIEKLAQLLEKKIVGNPLELQTDIGPLANKKQLQTIQDQVADAVSKGARIICGGKQPKNLAGCYYEPTLLNNISYDMKVWTEEVFGPVLPIVSFTTEQEAVDLANDTIFGLGAYVYSQNTNRALDIAKKLKTGNISINDTSYVIVQDPFGGYKKSGIGRTHGKIGMQSLCQVKIIAMNK